MNEPDGEYMPMYGGPLCARCHRTRDDHGLAPWPGPGLVCPPEAVARMNAIAQERLFRNPRYLLQEARELIDNALAQL